MISSYSRSIEPQTMQTLPTIDIVIPVLNEEAQLTLCVQSLYAYLQRTNKYQAHIVIADNGSNDGTPEIGKGLSQRMNGISYVRFDRPGRGHALTHCWSESQADLVAYMDVDLSTDLNCLPALLDPLLEGKTDISVGTRLSSKSRVRRSWKREILSRCYNRLIRTTFDVSFTDAQCGFKAMTSNAAKALLPLTKNKQWFWDSELLLLACHLDYRVTNTPVNWIEDRDSRVKLLPTIMEDIQGLIRMRRTLRHWGNRVQAAESIDCRLSRQNRTFLFEPSKGKAHR